MSLQDGGKHCSPRIISFNFSAIFLHDGGDHGSPQIIFFTVILMETLFFLTTLPDSCSALQHCLFGNFYRVLMSIDISCKFPYLTGHFSIINALTGGYCFLIFFVTPFNHPVKKRTTEVSSSVKPNIWDFMPVWKLILNHNLLFVSLLPVQSLYPTGITSSDYIIVMGLILTDLFIIALIMNANVSPKR